MLCFVGLFVPFVELKFDKHTPHSFVQDAAASSQLPLSLIGLSRSMKTSIIVYKLNTKPLAPSPSYAVATRMWRPDSTRLSIQLYDAVVPSHANHCQLGYSHLKQIGCHFSNDLFLFVDGGTASATSLPWVGDQGLEIPYFVVLVIVGLLATIIAIDMMCFCSRNFGILAYIYGSVSSQPDKRDMRGVIALDGGEYVILSTNIELPHSLLLLVPLVHSTLQKGYTCAHSGQEWSFLSVGIERTSYSFTSQLPAFYYLRSVVLSDP